MTIALQPVAQASVMSAKACVQFTDIVLKMTYVLYALLSYSNDYIYSAVISLKRSNSRSSSKVTISVNMLSGRTQIE